MFLTVAPELWTDLKECISGRPTYIGGSSLYLQKEAGEGNEGGNGCKNASFCQNLPPPPPTPLSLLASQECFISISQCGNQVPFIVVEKVISRGHGGISPPPS